MLLSPGEPPSAATNVKGETPHEVGVRMEHTREAPNELTGFLAEVWVFVAKGGEGIVQATTQYNTIQPAAKQIQQVQLDMKPTFFLKPSAVCIITLACLKIPEFHQFHGSRGTCANESKTDTVRDQVLYKCFT